MEEIDKFFKGIYWVLGNYWAIGFVWAFISCIVSTILNILSGKNSLGELCFGVLVGFPVSWLIWPITMITCALSVWTLLKNGRVQVIDYNKIEKWHETKIQPPPINGIKIIALYRDGFEIIFWGKFGDKEGWCSDDGEALLDDQFFAWGYLPNGKEVQKSK